MPTEAIDCDENMRLHYDDHFCIQIHDMIAAMRILWFGKAARAVFCLEAAMLRY